MNKELKKFTPRLVWFIFPYVLISVFTVLVFYKSGEIFWFKKTITAQSIERRNFIYGAAYSNLPNNFRLVAMEISSPKIIALGSSRVLQFRSAFFKDSISFYTTGGVFKRLEQLRVFLESLPEESLPQSIILGLDQWWFNAQYDSMIKIKNDLIYNKYSWIDNWNGIEYWQKFYSDLWHGKIELKKIWANNYSDVEYFGISARMSGFGYRKDGSRAYGNIISEGTTIKSRIASAIDSAKSNSGIFQWTNSIDKNSLNELRILLRFCKKHKIAITGFLPPIDVLVWSELKKQPAHFPHFFNLYNQLFPIFRDYGFHVYDFSNPENYGSNTFEMVDAVHGSEKSFLKLYLELLRSDTYLNQYSDSTFLKTELNKTKGNFDVFGNK